MMGGQGGFDLLVIGLFICKLCQTWRGRKDTRNRRDISPPACSRLPGESLVSTPQRGKRLLETHVKTRLHS